MSNSGVVLPKIIIGGVPKSGTTSLAQAISEVPGFFMPEKKELYYLVAGKIDESFDSDIIENCVYDFESYTSLFREGFTNIDGSTNYLYYANEFIASIKKIYPDPSDLKLIFILRNPVDRFISHYSYCVSRGLEPRSIETVLRDGPDPKYFSSRGWAKDYFGNGLYYEKVKAVIESKFDAKFMYFDDLIEGEGRSDIEDFIGVNRGSLSINKLNSTKAISSNFIRYHFFGPSRIKRFFSGFLPNAVKVKARIFRDKIFIFYKKNIFVSDEIKSQLLEFYKHDLKKLEVILPSSKKLMNNNTSGK